MTNYLLTDMLRFRQMLHFDVKSVFEIDLSIDIVLLIKRF